MTNENGLSTDEIKKIIGSYLKRIRTNKKITAIELGNKIEYSQSHISGIENAKKTLPTITFIQNYLLGLSDSLSEFDKYVKDIRTLTNDFYNLETVEQNLENYFKNDNKQNSLYEFTWKEKNGEKFTDWFPFLINDIHFYINDNLNDKFFNKIPLSNSDMNFINEMILVYLRNKYLSLRNDTNSKIINSNTHNKKSNTEDLKQRLEKYLLYLEVLERLHNNFYKED